ncbi:hypothetical protein SAMN04487948_101294 [Halogranum amylolyticum]|uniref:Adhesin n=1 Tax=Halogranum amylolyticum TaxID=660520 RepID=A0A1H8N437_9EURY|nr:hypothetical protein [Halogranum amylolyticum]SEO24354.1 hypothetical protein SAMN04487948_101294 [Halogranum amylolyticum]
MTTRHSGSRRAFLGTGAVLAVGAIAGCLGRGFGDDVAESTAESFPSDDVRSIEVRNAVGRVSVRGTATDAVAVRIDKRSQTGRRGLDAVTVGTTLTEGVLRIVASNVDGYLSLTSSLGTIEATDVTGLDHVYTELSEVTVDLLGLRGDVDVGTGMGSVAVGVADDLDLDLLAESGGRVSSNLALSGLRADRSAVSGQLNRGGSRLRVFSEMGEVDLRAIQRTT